MANKIIKNGKKYFQCSECGFNYKDEEWAEKCEEWCKEKHSCNIGITAHAVND